MNYWVNARDAALKQGDYLLVRYCQDQIKLLEETTNVTTN